VPALDPPLPFPAAPPVLVAPPAFVAPPLPEGAAAFVQPEPAKNKTKPVRGATNGAMREADTVGYLLRARRIALRRSL